MTSMASQAPATPRWSSSRDAGGAGEGEPGVAGAVHAGAVAYVVQVHSGVDYLLVFCLTVEYTAN